MRPADPVAGEKGYAPGGKAARGEFARTPRALAGTATGGRVECGKARAEN